MSKSVSALDGKAHVGFVKVEEQGLRGMLTIRGDLSSKGLRKAVTGLTGAKFPAKGACESKGPQSIAWMSPDELLVLLAYDDIASSVESLEKALKSEHALVANVSDARALIRMTGEGVREVLAKVSPVDMSHEAFKSGTFRRSRIAQVPAAFWMQDDATLDIICFRSVAGYVFDVLSRAAAEGTEVRYFSA